MCHIIYFHNFNFRLQNDCLYSSHVKIYLFHSDVTNWTVRHIQTDTLQTLHTIHSQFVIQFENGKNFDMRKKTIQKYINYYDKRIIHATHINCLLNVLKRGGRGEGPAGFASFFKAFNLKFDPCLFVDFYLVRAWAMWNTGN